MGECTNYSLKTFEKYIVSELCDLEKDTTAETRLKEAVVRVLHKLPKQRSKEDLQALGNFL